MPYEECVQRAVNCQLEAFVEVPPDEFTGDVRATVMAKLGLSEGFGGRIYESMLVVDCGEVDARPAYQGVMRRFYVRIRIVAPEGK